MSQALPTPASARAQSDFVQLLQEFKGTKREIFVYTAGASDSFVGTVELVADRTLHLLGQPNTDGSQVVVIIALEAIVAVEFTREGDGDGEPHRESAGDGDDTDSTLGGHRDTRVVPNVAVLGEERGVAGYHPM